MALIDRLILTLRAQERADGYRLDWAEIASTTDAMNWLLDYVRDESGAVWVETGVTERRRIAKELRRVRDRFTREWRERGGKP